MQPALAPKPRNDVAIILNANAKKVTQRVKQRLEQRNDRVDIYYSRSMEEAWDLAQHVLNVGYPIVMTGGGDGTIVHVINSLFQLTHRSPAFPSPTPESRRLQLLPPIRSSLPALAVLKLGTGNALASHVGAGRYDLDSIRIQDLVAAGIEPAKMELPLATAEGEVFPFAGLGWDAAILNDYNRVKDGAKSPVSKAVVKTVVGYLVAALGLTAPRVLFRKLPEVQIRALDSATLLGPDGVPFREFAPGDILYRGRTSMVAFSTIPYYGYKFTMFPFARNLVSSFQMRVASAGVPEIVSHLPSIWKGTYRSGTIMDFHCRNVELVFNEKIPYQVGGEARGDRETLQVGMSSYPIELVDYRSAVQ